MRVFSTLMSRTSLNSSYNVHLVIHISYSSRLHITFLFTIVSRGYGNRWIAGGASGHWNGLTRCRVEETVGNMKDTCVVATTPLRNAFSSTYPEVSTVNPSSRHDRRAHAYTVSVLEVQVIQRDITGVASSSDAFDLHTECFFTRQGNFALFPDVPLVSIQIPHEPEKKIGVV